MPLHLYRSAAAEPLPYSQLRQNNSLLLLILSLAIRIAGLARLVAVKEQNLAQSLVGVNLRRQRRGIRNLQRDKSLPLRLEGCHVHNNAAARIGRLPDADG